MLIGNREFDTAKCHIMGILNVTPDSFSDGGKWKVFDAAMRHTEEMIAGGADIIDIGGESTRPGYTMISEAEEIDRTAPVIEAIARRFDVPISIDTYKSSVARAALSVGACLVNDIWGLKADAKMAGVIAGSGAACCLTHNRDHIDYIDFLSDVRSDLAESLKIARDAGISERRIILDPGVGFAKTHEMNLLVINRLDALLALGYPILLGTSRKSVIGTVLGLPVTERLEGTLATTVIGVVRGVSFVRTHDVLETRRAITMAEAVLGASTQV